MYYPCILDHGQDRTLPYCSTARRSFKITRVMFSGGIQQDLWWKANESAKNAWWRWATDVTTGKQEHIGYLLDGREFISHRHRQACVWSIRCYRGRGESLEQPLAKHKNKPSMWPWFDEHWATVYCKYILKLGSYYRFCVWNLHRTKCFIWCTQCSTMPIYASNFCQVCLVNEYVSSTINGYSDNMNCNTYSICCVLIPFSG